MPVDAEMLAYYAARAPYYDAVYEKPERQADIAFLTTHLAERFRDRDVLEIACGTGYWSQVIAPAARSLVAIDAAREPLEFARLRPGVDKARFLEADAYALPPDLRNFDAAFAGLWLSHVPIGRRGDFFKALHERLSGAARVGLLDNSEVQCRELPIAERDGEGNTYQHRQLRDGTIHRVLKNFPTQAELEGMVSGVATSFAYRQLDNFWLFEYEIGG